MEIEEKILRGPPVGKQWFWRKVGLSERERRSEDDGRRRVKDIDFPVT